MSSGSGEPRALAGLGNRTRPLITGGDGHTVVWEPVLLANAWIGFERDQEHAHGLRRLGARCGVHPTHGPCSIPSRSRW
jgi:hypothetical protein